MEWQEGHDYYIVDLRSVEGLFGEWSTGKWAAN
jgi:hypothetical protein